MNKLGWIGSTLLALCPIPEVYRSITADVYDISIPFVLMWFIGEICLVIPVIKEIKKPYLIFNYVANIFCITIIIFRIISDTYL